MPTTQVNATTEFTDRSHGFVFTGQVTTDSGGAATLAHGMTNVDGTAKTPTNAIAIPEDGGAFATNLLVTVTGTNVVIAAGGNAVKYTVLAFG